MVDNDRPSKTAGVEESQLRSFGASAAPPVFKERHRGSSWRRRRAREGDFFWTQNSNLVKVCIITPKNLVVCYKSDWSVQATLEIVNDKVHGK